METTMFSRRALVLLAIWLDLVFLASTDQCDGNHHDCSMTKEDCGKCDDRHWFSSDANCMKCPKCDAGWGLEQSCGNGKGNDLFIGCIPCDHDKHLYSDKYDDKQCKSSPKCHEFYRAYIKVATSESPAICGDCLNGYFIPSYMDFHPDRITECDPCSLATSDEDLRVCSEGVTTVEYEEERANTSFSNTRGTRNETSTDQPYSSKDPPKSFLLSTEAKAGILPAVIGSAVFVLFLVLLVTVVLKIRGILCLEESGGVRSTSSSQSDDVELRFLESKEDDENGVENSNKPFIHVNILDESSSVDIQKLKQFESIGERNGLIQKANEVRTGVIRDELHKTGHTRELMVNAKDNMCDHSLLNNPPPCNIAAPTEGTSRVQSAMRTESNCIIQCEDGNSPKTPGQEQFEKACELLKGFPIMLLLRELHLDVRSSICTRLNTGGSYIKLAYSVFEDNQDNFYNFDKEILLDKCESVFEKCIHAKDLNVLDLLEHIDKIGRVDVRNYLAKYIIDNFEKLKTLANESTDKVGTNV
ncbi:unnamed protein product [Owenia fusiformis]|uniref:Uncharacterized protein n=1 Tax=Owenia fusiformis TaxID=6347 RepID=A0A8S4NA96_OWEFU|nr:unnamed protein product [Owenia fusiformis]